MGGSSEFPVVRRVHCLACMNLETLRMYYRLSTKSDCNVSTIMGKCRSRTKFATSILFN